MVELRGRRDGLGRLGAARRNAGVLAAVVLLLSGCGDDGARTVPDAGERAEPDAGERAGLPIADDFSGECLWSENDDEEIKLACEGGEYRVLYGRVDERIQHVMRRPVEEPVRSVSVETDVTLTDFPGDPVEDFQAHGVGCWASPVGATAQQGILFVVAPGVSTFAVVLQDETIEKTLRFLIEEESDAVAPAGQTTRIRGECQATDDGVDVSMSLDGKEVATARVPGQSAARARFQAFGFVSFSTRTDTDIRFDNFRAEELGD